MNIRIESKEVEESMYVVGVTLPLSSLHAPV